MNTNVILSDLGARRGNERDPIHRRLGTWSWVGTQAGRLASWVMQAFYSQLVRFTPQTHFLQGGILSTEVLPMSLNLLPVMTMRFYVHQ